MAYTSHSKVRDRTLTTRISLMAGLKDKRGFIDKDRLDLSERKAVEYWMKRWGVTRDQLTAAHRKGGGLTRDIAAELGKRRGPAPVRSPILTIRASKPTAPFVSETSRGATGCS